MARSAQLTRSVRIDRDVDEELKRLATGYGVSVNALATRALRRYAEWDSFAEKFGFIDMPATVVARMMGYLSDEQIRELGRWTGGTLLREYVTFWFKAISLETVLEACPRLLAKYARVFEFEEHTDGSRRTLILKHTGGRRASLFYEEVIKAAFEELLKQPLATERTENQVVARFAGPTGAPSAANGRPGA